ncbi:Fe(3+) ions import ATP-binding protein FbpC 1 [Microbacterium sp. C448]|uniref:ABC transporter ATP-binding protein n=1 Tax=Microbacterium sp. C448 TaxID=1177594 RepID=UPI0003DE338F|nr:ABC transporter ATP-binding protein [Microbacterium sp. C448]CDJ99866.1 Fe(3+) ions import ATP-binding protein FbpC 1 [Microbacterium sp. C448]
MTWVDVHKASIGFSQEPVLDELDLQVERGQIAAVLGPSGCGKSTLLRAIAGHLPLSAGTISIGERVLSTARGRVRPEKRGVGWVPQEASLFPHLSLRRNIGYGLRSAAERASRVDELATLVGLSRLLDRRPDELSGGQRQRAALARALAPRPQLLLLDEPFGALDRNLRNELRTDVAELLRDQEATALLVTHDQEEALSLADRVAIMREGRVLQVGTPREVYERPVDPWVANFIGETVELPGDLIGDRVQTPIGDFRGIGRAPDGAVRVIVRPEWIRLDADSALRCRVRSVQYAGHDALVEVRTESGFELTARAVAPNFPSPGDAVTVSIERGVLIFPV